MVRRGTKPSRLAMQRTSPRAKCPQPTGLIKLNGNMNKKKEKIAAIVAILVVFALLCMSCAAPIPLMIPVAEEGATVITEGALV